MFYRTILDAIKSNKKVSALFDLRKVKIWTSAKKLVYHLVNIVDGYGDLVDDFVQLFAI